MEKEKDQQGQNIQQEKDRRGDTSRTSNQGRKEASGGDLNDEKRGDRQIDPDTKAPVSDRDKKR